MGTCFTNGWPTAGLVSRVAHRGCYVVLRVMSNVRKRELLHSVNSLYRMIPKGSYWLDFESWGRSARAISDSPPTSRISMTMVLKRLVG